MRLGQLIAHMDVAEMQADPATEIGGVAYDSRQVRVGDLFFAIGGERHDGVEFIGPAIKAGAAAVVVSRAHEPSVPHLRVENPRVALAQAAIVFYGQPSLDLTLVAVTGTKGKTTTTYLIESILRADGRTAGLIGTTGYRIARETRSAPLTTPEAPELQALLREMVVRGVQAVALEVSSHALTQRRSYGLECDVAVFTNLGRDHLDYHGTFERYLDAKLMLFDGRNVERSQKATVAVVNVDDPHGPRVIEAAHRGGLETCRYGEAPEADLRLGAVEPHPGGVRFELAEKDRRIPIRLGLLGRHNAWNAAAAYASARALRIAPEAAARGLETVRNVPGRLERISEGLPYEVVVDYAHTPESLAAALVAVREHARGRVLLVFGCGGDRDRGKRPLMGRAAAEGSEVAWITNDNPRQEDPEQIAAEIRAGAARGRLRTELDRRAAIAQALDEAKAGDVVLIAGKGHESTQTIGDRVLPFDDRAVARALLGAKAEEGR